MDGVLVDFQSGIDALGEGLKEVYNERWDECPDIFSKMEPMPGAIDGFNKLSEKYDTYILSTAPWNNPSAWTDKYECGRQPNASCLQKIDTISQQTLERR